MFETIITIGKKKITLKFGSWAVGKLIRMGYPLTVLAEEIQTNPFDLIPSIAYVGACNKSGMKLDAHDESIFYEWLDENGINSKEVQAVINTFMESITSHVPEEKEKEPKKK